MKPRRTIHFFGRLAESWTIGLALGLFGAATILRFEDLLQPGSSLATLAVMALLSCLALGMSLPKRYAQYFSRFTLGRRTGGQRESIPAAAASGDAAEATAAQLQTLCAAGCVLGGLSMMGAHLLAQPLGCFSALALESFHWTSLTSQALDLALLCAYVLLPCVWLGIALNCVQRLTWLHVQRAPLTCGCVILGMSFGLALCRVLSGLPATLTELLAAMLLLLTAVATLRLAAPEDPVAPRESSTPAFSDRWRFILVWVLYAAAFLTAFYISTWRRLLVVGGPDQSGAAALGALGAGLLLSTFGRLRSWRSMRSIAVACMLVSACIAVVVAVAGVEACAVTASDDSIVLGRGGQWWVWIPVVLMGSVVGLVSFAVVERSPHPPTGLVSCSIAVCLGAAAACLALLPGGIIELRAFHLLVIMALVWLMMGGLVLIHEPRFRLRGRLPQAAVMIGVLGLLIVMLPKQASHWSVLLRGVSRSCSGTLRLVSHSGPIEGSENGSPLTVAGPMSLEAMLRRLRTAQEKYAGILITWPAESGEPASRKMRAALVRAAAARLRPDGVLLTRFRARDDASVAPLTQHVQ